MYVDYLAGRSSCKDVDYRYMYSCTILRSTGTGTCLLASL